MYYITFIRMCYGSYSSLFLGDTVITSQSGVQQGDPLGPALFCLVLQIVIDKLNTDLNAWFMDDGTLGGRPASVIHNFQQLIMEAQKIGLTVNIAKCELFLCGGTDAQRMSAADEFSRLFPGITITSAEKLNLLGSPLLPAAVVPMVNEKISQMGVMCDRLRLLPKHQALFLLKNCLAVPKIVHILRTSLAWMFPHELYRLDQVFRDAVESITNVRMDHPTWLQASLPVRFGGLGIRRTEKLAPSAYMASASSLHPLISKLCPKLTATDVTAATHAWKLTSDTDELPPLPFRHVQKAWDTPATLHAFSRLAAIRTTQEEVAHLKAVSVPESGVWIHALPAACLGNLLENNAFRISVALRLGAPIVTPHVCVCGGLVDELGRHGLRCKRSAGRLPRHDGISGEIARGLKTAGFPARMEPKGLSLKDKKRPDVITLVPWERGKPLAVDVTCVDTLAASYIDRTSVNVGAAAEQAERAKLTKHAWLQPRYNLKAAAFEIYGPWGCGTKTLVDKLFRTTSVSASFKPYIANLLLANLFLAIFENPLDILLELSCQHCTLSWAVCDLYLYCNYVITAWAIHAHLLITVNRLWALIFPYSYRDQHTISTSFLFIGGALVYVHIWSVPGLVLDSVFYRSMNDECEVNNDAQRTWALALQICLFLAPIVFVAGAYMYIIDRQPHKNTRQHINQAFLILTLLTCSVVITWTPYQICQLLQILDIPVSIHIVAALDVLWIVQSILDPLLSTRVVADMRTVFGLSGLK
ncbi:uncharacterized protein LOC129596644 [Paramacrobiotus metropolitanus]|uniref:uncharacterized protein LOC129596644 n=1 Tax=Paramacrobiotus metropolitanus TaxID=2943436 RepID=UPI00244581FB|nr:uncharacterized protein LOC129596644 [Paramacrobiotus metropolitanus]